MRNGLINRSRLDPGARPGAPARGFTLLEVLVSMTIFAVVISMVLTAMGSLTRMRRDHTGGLSPQEAAAACFYRIFMDLETIYVALPPAWHVPVSDDAVDPYRVVGSVTEVGGDRFGHLRFASLSHLPIGPDPLTGVAEIVYYVQAEEDGTGYTLRRTDRILPINPETADRPDPVLCQRLASFQIVYYDEAFDASDRWDSEAEDAEYRTPAAVGIRIGIQTEDGVAEFETLIDLPVIRSGQTTDSL